MAIDSFHPWRKPFFPGRPGLSHFGREQSNQQNNKSFGPTSPGVARDSFFLFLFILFIYLI
jgi:hypothetical protein